jgi:hypothetical protein
MNTYIIKHHAMMTYMVVDVSLRLEPGTRFHALAALPRGKNPRAFIG